MKKIHFMYNYVFPGEELCPVRLFKEYRRHRPVSCLAPESRMYIQPLPQSKIKSDVWYSMQPVGKNKLGSLVKQMYSAAGISGRHTNHSARRGMIQKALAHNVHESKVAQITGHRNLNSLNEYRTITIEQQREISELLTKSAPMQNTLPAFKSLYSRQHPYTSVKSPPVSTTCPSNKSSLC